eukprot:5338460-Karenia_brevis.AAC.1
MSCMSGCRMSAPFANRSFQTGGAMSAGIADEFDVLAEEFGMDEGDLQKKGKVPKETDKKKGKVPNETDMACLMPECEDNKKNKC